MIFAGLGVGALMSPALAASPAHGAIRAIAAAARVSIAAIETFDIQVPQPRSAKPLAQLRGGAIGRINIVRLTTNTGVRGYSFLVSSPQDVEAARKVLLGEDLFALETHLARGLLGWPAIEEAIWDAIGKIAGQPISRLLGGAALTSIPVYLTYVWPTAPDATRPEQQAAQAVLVRKAGFKAMKIQMFRSDPKVDADACAQILASGGPGFRVMVDRTANARGLWTYEQGLAAARALEQAGAYWLEEPFARDDFDTPAQLRKEVGILITSGEGWRGLAPFRESVLKGSFDILQPEVRTVSGLLMTRKVGVLAEAWSLPIAPHAASGLAVAGRLQCAAAMGAVYQELGPFRPPHMPWDLCEPFLPILHGKQPFAFGDGQIVVPQYPGLGLNIDDVAVERFRVEGFERLGPGTGPLPSALTTPSQG